MCGTLVIPSVVVEILIVQVLHIKGRLSIDLAQTFVLNNLSIPIFARRESWLLSRVDGEYDRARA